MEEKEYEKINNSNDMMKWIWDREKIDKNKKNILLAHQFVMWDGKLPKQNYKHNPTPGIYDSNLDYYCSLISWENFVNNFEYYIELAAQKSENKEQYEITKRL